MLMTSWLFFCYQFRILKSCWLRTANSQHYCRYQFRKQFLFFIKTLWVLGGAFKGPTDEGYFHVFSYSRNEERFLEPPQNPQNHRVVFASVGGSLLNTDGKTRLSVQVLRHFWLVFLAGKETCDLKTTKPLIVTSSFENPSKDQLPQLQVKSWENCLQLLTSNLNVCHLFWGSPFSRNHFTRLKLSTPALRFPPFFSGRHISKRCGGIRPAMRVSPLDLEGYALQLLRQLRQFWREGHLCLVSENNALGSRVGEIGGLQRLGRDWETWGDALRKKNNKGSFWERKSLKWKLFWC